MTKTTFQKCAFVNEIGQVLKPGDPVIMVSTGTDHNVNVRPGVYLGLRMKGSNVSSVSCAYYGHTYENGNLVKKARRTSLPRKRVYKLNTTDLVSAENHFPVEMTK